MLIKMFPKMPVWHSTDSGLGGTNEDKSIIKVCKYATGSRIYITTHWTHNNILITLLLAWGWRQPSWDYCPFYVGQTYTVRGSISFHSYSTGLQPEQAVSRPGLQQEQSISRTTTSRTRLQPEPWVSSKLNTKSPAPGSTRVQQIPRT